MSMASYLPCSHSTCDSVWVCGCVWVCVCVCLCVCVRLVPLRASPAVLPLLWVVEQGGVVTQWFTVSPPPSSSGRWWGSPW